MKTLDEAIQFHIDEAKKARDSALHIRTLMKSEIALQNAQEYEAEADVHEQYVSWLKELKARQDTEPILYEVTIDGRGGQDHFVCETTDERNIGLAGIQTTASGPYDLFRLMNLIAEKYAEAGFRVVFKLDTDVDGEWKKIYEPGVTTKYPEEG